MAWLQKRMLEALSKLSDTAHTMAAVHWGRCWFNKVFGFSTHWHSLLFVDSSVVLGVPNVKYVNLREDLIKPV